MQISTHPSFCVSIHPPTPNQYTLLQAAETCSKNILSIKKKRNKEHN